MISQLGLLIAFALGLSGVWAQTKTYALPAAATDGTSIANNVPNFMVLLDEGGSVPSEPKSTCDNRSDGNSKSTAGFHLERYFPAAKDSFDQKVTVLRQYMGLKQAVQAEAGSAAVVAETLDGAEALYFVVTQGCVEDANPSATRVEYRARVIRDATYADVSVSLYAAAPDAARKYAREMLQKISALNYASVK